MNGWWGGAAAAAGALGLAVVANVASEEIIGQLGRVPRAVIWLAIRRVASSCRADLEDEWLAELAAISRPSEGLPITRLLVGLRYALGLLRAAKVIEAELSGDTPRSPGKGRWAAAVLAVVSAALAAGLGWLPGSLLVPVVILVLVAFPVLAAAEALARAKEQEQLGHAVLALLCQAIETKDLFTLGHCERVCDRSVQLARELGLPAERVELVRQAALLHDAGKLGVPTTILQKPGALSEDEYSAIRLHCLRGREIGQDLGLPGEAVAAILHHHERIDGRGSTH